MRPSAASLLIALKQRLLKAAEQLERGKVETFLKEAEKQQKAPPKLTSKLLKDRAASEEKPNKEEVALQVSRRQLLSGFTAGAAVAAKLRRETGQQEREAKKRASAGIGCGSVLDPLDRILVISHVELGQTHKGLPEEGTAQGDKERLGDCND